MLINKIVVFGVLKIEVIEERPLHSDKVTVSCALWSEGVIGPYFFENNGGTIVKINSKCNGHMITDFFLSTIEEYDFENMCHMPHNSREALLQDIYVGRKISRRGDINWPPRSYDATPLDSCLWGYEKDRIYADKPSTFDHLKTNTRQVVTEVQQNMFQKVIDNNLKRINAYNTSRGSHLNDVVFQI